MVLLSNFPYWISEYKFYKFRSSTTIVFPLSFKVKDVIIEFETNELKLLFQMIINKVIINMINDEMKWKQIYLQ